MKKRIAKKIMKNKERLKYSDRQLEQASRKIAKISHKKEEGSKDN